MNIPLVDLKAQYKAIGPDVDAALARVLEHTQFIMGEEVARFEEGFAAFCGARYAVGVASGTAALHLALRAAGVGPGDEVITTPFTFIATAEAVIHCGARPVFVDIEPETFNLDPAGIEAAITQRTRAILPVHLYGQPAAMDTIAAVAEAHRLRVIEDAAQAHGAEYRGRRAGALADAGCFSFYPGKNLGAYGDGGMVVTDDAGIAQEVRELRDHGRSDKYLHRAVGFGERLDALQAAVLRAKLGYLPAWIEARRRAASHYDSLLTGTPGLTLPRAAPDVSHAYHLYVVRSPLRERLAARLKEAGIGTGIHYPIPLHLQPALSELGYKHGDFPEAERAAAEVLSLPIYPEITPEQIAWVAGAVRDFFRHEAGE